MNWRKSTRSGTGNCLEAASFRKSSHSMNHGDCAEARTGRGTVGVRDSALEGSPVLEFTPGTWTAFTSRLKDAR